MRAGAMVAARLLLAATSCCWCCAGAPVKGTELAARSDNVEALNEPCYVHDAACVGYPVCCVTKGTCISQHSGTISSNTAYYEGGCQSLDSSKKTWANQACTQQGECLVQHLEVCKGGTTQATFMTEVPSATLARFMANSCENDCPSGGYGHGSYGSGGGDDDSGSTTTVTTTTTVITRVTSEFELKISNVEGVQSEANLQNMVVMTIAALAGFGTDHSMITLANFSISSLGQGAVVTAHLDVSSAHSVTSSAVQDALAGVTQAQMNEALAMRVGTCSYTVERQLPMATNGAGAVAPQLLSVALVLWPLWSHRRQ